jgi:hypothetical protein
MDVGARIKFWPSGCLYALLRNFFAQRRRSLDLRGAAGDGEPSCRLVFTVLTQARNKPEARSDKNKGVAKFIATPFFRTKFGGPVGAD